MPFCPWFLSKQTVALEIRACLPCPRLTLFGGNVGARRRLLALLLVLPESAVPSPAALVRQQDTHHIRAKARTAASEQHADVGGASDTSLSDGHAGLVTGEWRVKGSSSERRANNVTSAPLDTAQAKSTPQATELGGTLPVAVYIVVPSIRGLKDLVPISNAVKSVQRWLNATPYLINNGHDTITLPLILGNDSLPVRGVIPGRRKFSAGALIDAIQHMQSHGSQGEHLVLLQHSSRLRGPVQLQAPLCSIQTLGEAKPQALGIEARHPGMLWASRLLSDVFDVTCGPPCALISHDSSTARKSDAHLHLSNWSCFPNNNLLVSATAVAELHRHKSFASRIDADSSIDKLRDKGAERLWGILSAAWELRAGIKHGHGVSRCQQKVISKVHAHSK